MDQQNQKRPNSGYLFPNKDKRTDKQPDWRGKFNDPAGKEWLVSGWNRNKDGDNMVSFQFTDPSSLPARDAAPGAAPGAPRAATGSAGGARGPMARPAAPSPTPAGPPKAFQPGKAGTANQDDLEDLDSLFQGFDDDTK